MTRFTDGVWPTEQVQYAKRGRAGLIRLNRPAAINSLTTEMVTSMLEQLRVWVDDDGIDVVVLAGAGDRGLCAGGDVRAMRDLCLAGEEGRREAVHFWDTEYALNSAIHHYPKPFVALMDGVTMGGGIGLGGHAGLRIVTERSTVAMPETNIGFFPDVGGSLLLARTTGRFGHHLAMTGASATGADAVALGIADVLVDSRALPEIVEGLVEGEVPEPGMIGTTEVEAPLLRQRSWIDSCYDAATPVEVVERLRAATQEQAHAAADAIEARSPLSVSVALRALRRARRLDDLDAVLAQDAVLARGFSREPDFIEGVRALLVDKTKDPHWRHPGLAQVPPEDVDAFFAGLPDLEP